MKTMRTAPKLGLLASLYFSQGLPFGFFVQALPVLLRRQDLSLEAIGLTSLLALPWALKFLWAPLVDRAGAGEANHRKRWIVPLQISAALVMLGASLIQPSSMLGALLVCVLIANLLAATQDIATDGLAVDLLDREERGLGNGVQVAGYRVGMIMGGGALLVAYDQLGWSWTFITLSGLLLVATLPIMLTPEPARASAAALTSGASEASPGDEASPDEVGAFRRFVSRRGAWAWLAVLCLYKMGEALGGGMLRPFLVDRGLSVGEVGAMLGVAGFTAGLLGALVGGWLVQRVGRLSALLVFGVVQSLGVLGYLLPALLPELPRQALYALCMGEHFTGGLATVALFTLMMDACGEQSSATDYTLQASVVVITTGAAAALSGFVAGPLGYAWHFGISGVLSLLGVAATLALWPLASPMITAETARCS